MEKHWTHFLPEGGVITKRGDRQLRLLDKIAAVKEQLARLEAECYDEDKDITEEAKRDWTDLEIADAKWAWSAWNAKRKDKKQTPCWPQYSKFFIKDKFFKTEVK